MNRSTSIIQPGPDLVRAARALGDPRRKIGEFPYQWQFPGPDSDQVLANDVIAMPGAAAKTLVLQYEVPEGVLFSLRGIVFDPLVLDASWVEGSAGIVMTLLAISAGQRNVDYLQSFRTRLGSRISGPYPILGRLEFAPNTVLQMNVSTDGSVTAALPNAITGHLVGHTYPHAES